MSGIGIAVAAGVDAGGAPAPPPSPLSLSFFWEGAAVVNVSGASGGTSGSDRFVHAISGGTTPYPSADPTITYNPSGKLNIFALGGQIGVSWNGMSINEVEPITVRYDVTDSAGNSVSGSDSCFIKRVS